MKHRNLIITALIILNAQCSIFNSFAQTYPIQKIDLRDVRLTDNFWLPKIRQIQQVTIPVAFERCEKEGRFENFLAAGKVMNGDTGKVRGKMPFDDTDVYKIIEGASLSLVSAPDAKLEAQLDKYIAIIARGQEPDGYLTTWRTINPAEPPAKWVGKCEKRWDNLAMSHELYNAGHLYEAAAAHYYATGKRNFLDIALKNADLIVKVFGAPDNYDVPGHEIIETGLIKLYLITGKKAYFNLAKKFVDLRGTSGHRQPRGEYWQDDKPVLQHDEVVGHAVRAVYFYAGVTDVAAMTGDNSYKNAVKRLWNNMTNRKMYVTGGLGARHDGEAFGKNYELPNLTAYNETCAAIGGVMWADRMFQLFGEADYYHILERILYNAVLPGISLDGTCFFYPNPLESDGVYKFNQGHLTRAGWFDCSCCPTNLIRFLPSLPNLIYNTDQQGIYVNLFVGNEAKIPFGKNTVNITQIANYPLDGKVNIAVNPKQSAKFTLKIRIPDWATNRFPSELYTYENNVSTPVRVLLNGKEFDFQANNGYIEINRQWKKGDKIEIDFPMEVREIAANPLIEDDRGKTALQYGALVYCMENVDNQDSYDKLSLFSKQGKFVIKNNQNKLGGINEIFTTGGSQTWNFIPYYTWSNRGEGKMQVWVKSDFRSYATYCAFSQTVVFQSNKQVEIFVSKDEKPVVKTALEILQKDIKNVFDAELIVAGKPEKIGIIAGTFNQNAEIQKFIKENKIDISEIEGKWEAFQIQFINNKLLIIGSDARGTAYGLLEISRMIGVSPWEWWADATPEKQSKFSLPEDYKNVQSPSVQYRGIFLNDEDWGLNPWSSKTFETDAKTKFPVAGRFKGQVGPKTYAKIFELMIRLRANTIWPAMHEVTMPFYFVEGNRETAEKYGILVGTSHCEPMVRNSATEWDLTHKSAYNFFTNRDSVISYWEERLKELKNSENIFTIGMRGKHDGRMEGAKTTEQYKDALAEVIVAQTELLKKYVSLDISEIPQQFVPYKEVLDVYNAGLEVPDYVTLVWCDDNFGYIRHFPNEKEQQRGGGNGVYYHASYWGAPHDNLWLGMVSPALMVQQMRFAYEKNARKIWILNVGDLKPSEYLTELFLDLAWKAPLEQNGGKVHLQNWLQREFGEKTGAELLPVLWKHYRLGHIRRPEFLGNTRVYDSNGKTVSDLPFSEQEIEKRLADYQELSDKTEQIELQIPENKKAEYFQLVKYPIQAAAQMNFKMLNAQLARHEKADWARSDAAFDSIASLTKIYNSLNNGKWNGMMDYQPRKLLVFERVKRDTVNAPLQKDSYIVIQPENSGKLNEMEGLGISGKAFLLPKNSEATYFIASNSDSIIVEIRLVPTHAVEGKQLRFSVSIDGSERQITNYETVEYSEEWKENILRNYAVRQYAFLVKTEISSHKLKITALDEGVLIDEVLIMDLNAYAFIIESK